MDSSRLPRTLNINESALFLNAKPETVRRLASLGKLPGAKIGRGWCFLEEDLVMYLRSQYSAPATSQGAVKRSQEQWRFIKERKHGGLPSAMEDKEYSEVLGLRIG